MIILQTQQLSKAYGVKTVLTDINIQIQANDRIGLVGINGAGKSTLLKILSGEILPDSGQVQSLKGVKIGYLAQNSGLRTDNNIWAEMLSVFEQLIEKEKNIRSLEEKMADPHLIADKGKYEKLMNEYIRITDEFRDNGGYSYEAKIRSILHGLGFQEYDYYNQPIHTLSGGEKTRLALAKLLLEEPELIILDEPTNYLDVTTITWLEGYLKNYSGAIFVVSHDRYFLDTLVNIIYELENTKISKFTGNYTKYVEQKEKHLELILKQYEKQQDEIAKLEDFVQRNIARASTSSRAKSRRKILEKIETIDLPTRQRRAEFNFETEVKSGKNVLMVKNLAMSFNDNLLFANVNFNLTNQERVALIGPNGTGKSTLFQLIIKNLEPKTGLIEYGSNVKIGYFAQEQNNLNINKTVIDEIWDEYPNLTETEIRTTLGNFLFVGDDVLKKIKDLSGGEKARVSLAKLMLQKANFLLLDEPTNHLDIFSREVLEDALLDYNGTILFISHDRYFLNKMASRIIELTKSGISNFLGNYNYYLEKTAEQEEVAKKELNTREASNKNDYAKEREKQKQERQLKRKIENLEIEIEQIENIISVCEKELLKPEVYLDYQLSLEKTEKLNQAKENLDNLLSEWEKTQEELECLF